MRLRVAIIGAGHLGKIHARLLQQHNEAELVAVADPVTENRNALAHEFDCQSWADYRQHLSEFDAAIVAAPTRFHHRISVELLQNQIHTFVEKPLAANANEAKEIVNAAEASRCVLQVGHVERFNPAFVVARQQFERPDFISARRTSGFAFRSTDIGVVLDLMVHDIDLTLDWVNSPIVEVRATGFSVLGGHEDVAHAWLRFRSGCVASLHASRVSPENSRSFEVVAHQKIAHLDLASGETQVLGPGPSWPCTNEMIDHMSFPERREAQAQFFPNCLQQVSPAVQPTNAILDEQHDFLHAIRYGNSPRVSGDQGRRVVEVAHRILNSMHVEDWTDDSTFLRRAG